MARLRLSLDLTQREVAEKGGLEPTRLNAMERGRATGPGREVVERVAKGLGVDETLSNELQAIAARDRVMREAMRNLPTSVHGLVSACLDACQTLTEEDVRQVELGLRQVVSAKKRLKSFLSKNEDPL